MAMLKLKIKARKLYPLFENGPLCPNLWIWGVSPQDERYEVCLNVWDGEWHGCQMMVGWCEYFEKSGFSTYSLI